jgi:hypothetical protein
MSFGSNAGPPMLPNYFYNNNYTIVQNADHVLIMTEMINDVRDHPRWVTVLDSLRTFAPGWAIRGARYEGDTLVVETTNINPGQRFRGSLQTRLKVIERFTRRR